MLKVDVLMMGKTRSVVSFVVVIMAIYAIVVIVVTYWLFM